MGECTKGGNTKQSHQLFVETSVKCVRKIPIKPKAHWSFCVSNWRKWRRASLWFRPFSPRESSLPFHSGTFPLSHLHGKLGSFVKLFNSYLILWYSFNFSQVWIHVWKRICQKRAWRLDWRYSAWKYWPKPSTTSFLNPCKYHYFFLCTFFFKKLINSKL